MSNHILVQKCMNIVYLYSIATRFAVLVNIVNKYAALDTLVIIEILTIAKLKITGEPHAVHRHIVKCIFANLNGFLCCLQQKCQLNTINIQKVCYHGFSLLCKLKKRRNIIEMDAMNTHTIDRPVVIHFFRLIFIRNVHTPTQIKSELQCKQHKFQMDVCF